MPGIVWEGRLLGVVTVTLAVFGVAAVYGASSIWAVQNGQPGSYFALRQLGGLLLGTILLLIAVRVDYRRWYQHAWPLLGIAAVLLIVLLLPFTRAIAPEVNGARRWLNLGFLTLQPSELAKLAVVIWTAMLAAKKGEGVREFKRGVVPFLTILVPVCALILFEPDLSAAMVVALLAGIVLFAAGARIGHFLVLGLVAIPILWHEIASVQYRLARMVSFLSEGSDAGEQSWQITQSLIGIGAGKVVGVGFGEGFQKLGYLPYAYSDFLFSTIGEEWGFVGVTLIVLLFGVYLTLGIRIARTAPDAFGTLLAVGITSMIGLAAFLHMAVTLDLVPTTGIGLPFLSYGRSSLVVSLFATGVLINVGHARAGRGPA
jgi:cell division protein FtsW